MTLWLWACRCLLCSAIIPLCAFSPLVSFHLLLLTECVFFAISSIDFDHLSIRLQFKHLQIHKKKGREKKMIVQYTHQYHLHTHTRQIYKRCVFGKYTWLLVTTCWLAVCLCRISFFFVLCGILIFFHICDLRVRESKGDRESENTLGVFVTSFANRFGF